MIAVAREELSSEYQVEREGDKRDALWMAVPKCECQAREDENAHTRENTLRISMVILMTTPFPMGLNTCTVLTRLISRQGRYSE